MPEEALPRPQARSRPNKSKGPIVDLLKVLLKAKCEEHGVAQKLVATVDDLERIAAGGEREIPPLTGWRHEIFGKDALRLKRGEVALTADSNGVRLISTDPDGSSHKEGSDATVRCNSLLTTSNPAPWSQVQAPRDGSQPSLDKFAVEMRILAAHMKRHFAGTPFQSRSRQNAGSAAESVSPRRSETPTSFACSTIACSTRVRAGSVTGASPVPLYRA